MIMRPPHFSSIHSAIAGMMNTDSMLAANDETDDPAKSEPVGQQQRPVLVSAGLSKSPNENDAAMRNLSVGTLW